MAKLMKACDCPSFPCVHNQETKQKKQEVSIKDAINYAIDLIYALNERNPKPLDNPFELISDLPKELFLLKFRDDE